MAEDIEWIDGEWSEEDESLPSESAAESEPFFVHVSDDEAIMEEDLDRAWEVAEKERAVITDFTRGSPMTTLKRGELPGAEDGVCAHPKEQRDDTAEGEALERLLELIGGVDGDTLREEMRAAITSHSPPLKELERRMFAMRTLLWALSIVVVSVLCWGSPPTAAIVALSIGAGGMAMFASQALRKWTVEATGYAVLRLSDGALSNRVEKVIVKQKEVLDSVTLLKTCIHKCLIRIQEEQLVGQGYRLGRWWCPPIERVEHSSTGKMRSRELRKQVKDVLGGLCRHLCSTAAEEILFSLEDSWQMEALSRCDVGYLALEESFGKEQIALAIHTCGVQERRLHCRAAEGSAYVEQSGEGDVTRCGGERVLFLTSLKGIRNLLSLLLAKFFVLEMAVISSLPRRSPTGVTSFTEMAVCCLEGCFRSRAYHTLEHVLSELLEQLTDARGLLARSTERREPLVPREREQKLNSKEKDPRLGKMARMIHELSSLRLSIDSLSVQLKIQEEDVLQALSSEMETSDDSGIRGSTEKWNLWLISREESMEKAGIDLERALAACGDTVTSLRRWRQPSEAHQQEDRGSPDSEAAIEDRKSEINGPSLIDASSPVVTSGPENFEAYTGPPDKPEHRNDFDIEAFRPTLLREVLSLTLPPLVESSLSTGGPLTRTKGEKFVKAPQGEEEESGHQRGDLLHELRNVLPSRRE